MTTVDSILQRYYGRPAYARQGERGLEIREVGTEILIDGEFEDPPEIILTAVENPKDQKLLDNVMQHLTWLDETAEQYEMLEAYAT